MQAVLGSAAAGDVIGGVYCLPWQPCYPAPALFAALNESLTGLVHHRPPRPPCTPTSELEQPCRSADFLIDHPGAVMFTNFENGWDTGNATAAPVNEPGSSPHGGRMPEYLVEARSTADVQHAVRFAKEHKLRLRVLNTGHDYLGRSTDTGSFTIWTHRLDRTEYIPEFTPANAPALFMPRRAIKVGAGVTVKQANKAADEADVLIASGVSLTVGAGGGFVLGGGHDVLEMTVVTADGNVVTASPFQNESLFKAMRGGGGAFGVLIETVMQAHSPPEGFIGIFGHFDVAADLDKNLAADAYRDLIREWIKLQPALSSLAPFAGYSYLRRPGTIPFAYILPSADMVFAQESFQPFADFVNADARFTMSLSYTKSEKWQTLHAGAFTKALMSLDEVGINLLLGGRLVPDTYVRDNATELADFLSASPSPAIVHLVAGHAVAREPEFPSSVHPSWRGAMLHIDLPVAWPPNTPSERIKSLEQYLLKQVQSLGRLVSSGGVPESAYSSEANFHEEEWQRIWYGKENYKSLLEAKRDWDPEALFSARRYVGSEIPASHKRKRAYRIHKHIGSGGFGQVHQATSLETDEEVAIKIILKAKYFGYFGSSAHRFESRDKFYLVFELAAGGELFDHIIDVGRFGEAEAKEVAYAMTSAVAYLANRNILHRDIKPENVLYRNPPGHNDAGHDDCVLSDFGLATEVPRDRKLHTIAGSAGYGAPEVYSEAGYGLPADCWSLGVVTFVCIGGRFPYRATLAHEIAEEARTTELYFPATWDDISETCKDFVRRLLTYDPERRMTAAEALRHPWLLDAVSRPPSPSQTQANSPVIVNDMAPKARLKDPVEPTPEIARRPTVVSKGQDTRAAI
ncbi:hypothetical protein OIV83_004891 [Microbotryomycetes sp. JL201]|nr:hypothetical protein OIV83_004891 [Microbotryomycetes sp. JL201]